MRGALATADCEPDDPGLRPIYLPAFQIDQFYQPIESARDTHKNTLSFQDAGMFCKDRGMRLCTELEWAKAMRGGCARLGCPEKDLDCCRERSGRFPWGDDPDPPACDGAAWSPNSACSVTPGGLLQALGHLPGWALGPNCADHDTCFTSDTYAGLPVGPDEVWAVGPADACSPTGGPPTGGIGDPEACPYTYFPVHCGVCDPLAAAPCASPLHCKRFTGDFYTYPSQAAGVRCCRDAEAP